MGELEISIYLQELASANPTPGGGAAAALTGAQGVALLTMVCNLTIGKKKFADVEDEIRSILDILDRNRGVFLDLADKDTQVFQLVINAYKLPKETPVESEVRIKAIQNALKASSEVLFHLFKTCLTMLPLADRLEQIANPSVLSDVLVGRYLILASLLSAKANVDINLDGIEDESYCMERRLYMEEALGKSRDKHRLLIN